MIDGTDQRHLKENMFRDSIESLVFWLEAHEFETAIMAADRMLKEGELPGRELSPEMLSKIRGLKGVAHASAREFEKAIPLLREGLKHSDGGCIKTIKICLSKALFEDTFVKYQGKNIPIPPERIREIIGFSEEVLEFYNDNQIFGNLGHAYLVAKNYFEAAKCFHTKIRFSNGRYNAADLANLATAVGMLPGGFEKSKAIFEKAFMLADLKGETSITDYITEAFNGIAELHNSGIKIAFFAPPYDLSRN
jgi:tetratricopeptide (TPR) repeat protein